jgi:hypothetical protein
MFGGLSLGCTSIQPTATAVAAGAYIERRRRLRPVYGRIRADREGRYLNHLCSARLRCGCDCDDGEGDRQHGGRTDQDGTSESRAHGVSRPEERRAARKRVVFGKGSEGAAEV